MASKVAALVMWFAGIAMTALLLAQCALFDAILGPPKWEVLAALATFQDGVAEANTGTASSSPTSVTWANSEGSAAFEYTIPTGTPSSFPGQYTFNNYSSARSNFVLAGTLAIALNNPYYGTVGGFYRVADLVTTGTLSLSGGSIPSLEFNVTSTLYASTSDGSAHFSASDYGGTVSANGASFDVARLYE